MCLELFTVFTTGSIISGINQAFRKTLYVKNMKMN